MESWHCSEQRARIWVQPWSRCRLQHRLRFRNVLANSIKAVECELESEWLAEKVLLHIVGESNAVFQNKDPVLWHVGEFWIRNEHLVEWFYRESANADGWTLQISIFIIPFKKSLALKCIEMVKFCVISFILYLCVFMSNPSVKIAFFVWKKLFKLYWWISTLLS